MKTKEQEIKEAIAKAIVELNTDMIVLDLLGKKSLEGSIGSNPEIVEMCRRLAILEDQGDEGDAGITVRYGGRVFYEDRGES